MTFLSLLVPHLRSLATTVIISYMLSGDPVDLDAADRIPARAGGDILVTPIVHASVQVEYGNLLLQIDPWRVGNYRNDKRADLILVTDDVSHHLDPSAIAQLRGHGAPVVIPASGLHVIPDGIVMANGDVRELAGVHVRAVPAYDLTAGTPAHPKGQANGYLVTVGGSTLFFAGVTECVPELSQLGPIDVAFIPLNIPPNRMTPADAAACVKRIQPKRVYPYHYDQDRASALSRPGGSTRLPAGVSVEESLQHFEEYLSGSGTLVRRGAWYPTSPAPAHH